MKQKTVALDFASREGCELQIANLEEQIIDLVNAVDDVSLRGATKEQDDVYGIAFKDDSIQRPCTVGSRSLDDSRGHEQLALDQMDGNNSRAQQVAGSD